MGSGPVVKATVGDTTIIKAPGEPIITAIKAAPPEKKPAVGGAPPMGIVVKRARIVNPIAAGGVTMSESQRDAVAGTNVLLVADSGMHKTFMAGTFPRPIFSDLDSGMGTADYRKKLSHAVFRDAPRGMPVTDSMRDRGLYPWGDAWPRFFEFVNQIGADIDKGTCPYETFVIDSLTFMTQIARNNVMLLGKRDVPDQGVYGAEQEYLKSVLGPLVIWPIRLVCTAHIQTDKNDITGNIEKLPLLTGKLAGLIGAFFEEVYFITSEGEGTGRKWQLLTEPAPNMRQAKTRKGVPHKTEAHWDNIKKYMEP